MKKLSIFPVVIGGSIGILGIQCVKKKVPNPLSQVNLFFKQSTRRIDCVTPGLPKNCSSEVTDEERELVAKMSIFKNSLPISSFGTQVGGECSAFFVENNLGEIFIVTARHCGSKNRFTLREACNKKFQYQDGGITYGVRATFMQTLGDTLQVHTCTESLIEDNEMDIVFMRMDKSHNIDETHFFKKSKLAAFVPEKGTKLKMVGFPSDSIADGRLTVTENCESTTTTPDPRVGRKPGNSSQFPDDRYIDHNCSTYGGNSGGPIYIEGTQIVVGLPGAASPDSVQADGTIIYSEIDSWMNLMSDYVKKHKKELDELGVITCSALDKCQ